MTIESERQLHIAIDNVKELMAANFKTTQVQLDGLGRVGRDVEQLKRDMADLKVEQSMHGAYLTNLDANLKHIETDFMRREDVEERYLPRKIYEDSARWRKTQLPTVILSALSLAVSAAVGVHIVF